ncbi:hypothetical protein [Rugamonas aquatica]|uniref:Uncharacterized protein n=1 Tax=Rugamonas aquatica TaxID=2743357 RepID=A0A6A7MYK4_9BURK|nr:hypothetical protein [Rugamonas aquatica]MQA37846.1 hypothetical protein [Rugamonas aquatica]
MKNEYRKTAAPAAKATAPAAIQAPDFAKMRAMAQEITAKLDSVKQGFEAIGTELTQIGTGFADIRKKLATLKVQTSAPKATTPSQTRFDAFVSKHFAHYTKGASNA